MHAETQAKSRTVRLGLGHVDRDCLHFATFKGLTLHLPDEGHICATATTVGPLPLTPLLTSVVMDLEQTIHTGQLAPAEYSPIGEDYPARDATISQQWLDMNLQKALLQPIDLDARRPERWSITTPSVRQLNTQGPVGPKPINGS